GNRRRARRDRRGCSCVGAGGGRLQRGVLELARLAPSAEQATTAAHVAAAPELARKKQPLAEDLDERRHVLVRGDAAEQDEARVRSVPFGELARMAVERRREARIVFVDRDG